MASIIARIFNMHSQHYCAQHSANITTTLTMADTNSESTISGTPIFRLPDELLEAIVSHLPPTSTLAFGSTSKRSNKITYEPLVWRRHCVQTWRYWELKHDFEDRLLAPPSLTKWRQLYNERRRMDREAFELFDTMLLTQQERYHRMKKIADNGYDVKDLMLRLRDETPDDAKDVLARRYHANAILGQIHRATALEKWMRLQKRQMVKLEEVLGAYDLFVLGGSHGDLTDIDREFDRLAKCIQDRDPDFEELSTRKKAIQVAKYLRSEGLVGNQHLENYHDLRNNFISMALFDDAHTSLPLQSVAIYCAVARRLGINAKPSNYPQHVHAVIEAPSDSTLDGISKPPTQDAEPEIMHLDPWRSSNEVPPEHLQLRLGQMGVLYQQHPQHMRAATNFEVALRTGRNIMTSVQEARDRQTGRGRSPDIESAWYSMLWSMLILGDSSPATTLHRRRQCLPYLVEHFQAHFPEDIGLIEKHVPSMFEGEREHQVIMRLVDTARTGDRNAKAPTYRTAIANNVHHRVGQHFTHRRFGYNGVIVGWDTRCGAAPQWIAQMNVDDLPRGREQPFYNVMYDSPEMRPPCRIFYRVLYVPADDDSRADDKSVRYVAEENIQVSTEKPCDVLMQIAGRYFKRWDESGFFVSNIRDEYPDD